MAEGLVCSGHEVHVATTDDDGPGRLEVPLGRPVTERGVRYWYFRRQARFYTVSWPLAFWLRRYAGGYDVLHVHALFSFASALAAYWARRHGVPYIIRPLGTLNRWGMAQRRPRLKSLSFRVLERRILAGAAAVHYTSEQERIEASDLGIRARATVVPLGIDLARLEPLPPRGWLAGRAPHLAGRTVVLFLSRLDEKKGLHLLLRAFAKLRATDEKVALVVAGSGMPEFESSLRREARHLGVEDDTVWAGFLHGEEKLAVLADADMFILPSYSENFGLAAVEAMAAGVPVILSDQVGIHREVAAAGAGLVVRCCKESVAGAIARLAADPELRHAAGQRGRRLARDRFSVEAMTAGLAEMYGAATNGRLAGAAGIRQ
jgi:glycosyltransferase involved in cell wall biosynthesis